MPVESVNIADSFRAAATAYPEQLAIWCDGSEISYRDLDAASDALARWLSGGAGDRASGMLAIHLPKSIDAIVAILAAFKSNTTYVPVDPKWPLPRRSSIFSQCRFDRVISNDPLPDELNTGADVLLCDSADWRSLLADSSEFDFPAPQPDDIAYLLFTSGSTGEPKGVSVSHRAARLFPNWARNEFALSPDDRIASIAPLTFDLSTFDFFAGLGAGASVYIVPEMAKMLPSALSRFLEEHRITTMYAVPSNLGLLAARGVLHKRNLSALRTVLFAGEEFPLPLFRDFAARLPDGVRFCNLYGPTETNVCTWFDTAKLREDDTAIPIGEALPGFDLFALAEDGNSIAADGSGELCAIGDGVMSGYWGREDDSCWVELPDKSEPAYRTGDRVTRRADGNWLYHGRIDTMVKIWGYRVELGEVESCLLSFPGVEQAAVVKRAAAGRFDDALIGFVVADDVDDGRLLAHCKERLPSYMRPQAIRHLDNLPLSQNGKIDRRRLQGMAAPEASA